MSDNAKKELTPAQLKKKADQAAIKVVHTFMKKYSELEDEDDLGHEANEEMLIKNLYDIYDPEESKN